MANSYPEMDLSVKAFMVRVLTESNLLSEICTKMNCEPNELFVFCGDISSVYRGVRNEANRDDSCLVFINDSRLSLYSEVGKFSNQFEWGYGGAGPLQLSNAILADLLKIGEAEMIGPESLLLRMRDLIVTKLPRDREWKITGMQILRILSGVSTFEKELPQYCG